MPHLRYGYAAKLGCVFVVTKLCCGEAAALVFGEARTETHWLPYKGGEGGRNVPTCLSSTNTSLVHDAQTGKQVLISHSYRQDPEVVDGR